MQIFEFGDYKAYLKQRIAALPKRGRGELSRIAKVLDIHTTMVTHVLRGQAQFSLEQTLKLAEHLALNELETEYLVALVQLERAGDKRSQAFARKRVEELKARASNLKERLGTTNELSDADRAQYYSSWTYAAVRLLSSIERFSSAEAIAKALDLPLARVRAIAEFLVSRGLCVEDRGRLGYGPMPTYLESGSPLVIRHHLNWRQKSQERFERLRSEDLVFTYPVAMSEKDFAIVRENLIQFIDGFRKISTPSPSDNLYCLNVDWLKLQD